MELKLKDLSEEQPKENKLYKVLIRNLSNNGRKSLAQWNEDGFTLVNDELGDEDYIFGFYT
ncbi:hypothetical protein [Winogradskyella pulchriflava]|uniref:Uncharacterized protein n=1 Tax=Winogradskyella pulchriflava TaxID=1110688 RepID=A0ABV6QA67_9FLAO